MNDPANKFEIARANRSTYLKESADSAEQWEARREGQRKSWAGPNREGVQHGPAGTVLDPKALAAKKAWEAEKTATQQKAEFDAQPISFSLNEDDMRAILEGFIRQQPEFYDTPFNRTNLLNCVLYNLHQKRLTGFNLESLQRCFVWLHDNGYMEAPRVRPRGTAASVPKIFPTFVLPKTQEELEAEKQHTLEKAVALHESELRTAKNMSFEELQNAARKNYNRKAYQHANS